MQFKARLLPLLRSAAQPFMFAGAMGLGIWLWLKLGDVSLARCPPDLVWYGGTDGDKKCNWPLAVYLAKDMAGAALTGALPVLLCAALAPARKLVAASIAATVVCALALLYLVGGAHELRPTSLVFAVKLAFGVSSWCAVWCVSRLAHSQPPGATGG